MSTSGYAKFLRDIGHDVREEAGAYWFNVFPHVYQSFPFQKELSRDAVEASGFVGKRGCWIARYPCHLSEGRQSYRLSVMDSNYGMESLTSKARNQTRRALEQCQCRALGFDELLKSGIELNLETLRRQGRNPEKNFDSNWTVYYRCAAKADGADAWGCFVGERLAAYLIAFRMEDVSHVLIVRSHGELLKHYPNNALLFTYLQHCFAEGLREVSIGFEGLQEELSSLDHFKDGLGFKRKPVGQRIDISPWILPFFPMLTLVARIMPRSERVAKFVGMVGWHNKQIRKL